LEKSRERIVLARIVEFDPYLSNLAIEISLGQMLFAKVHLVSAEEAQYLMLLENPDNNAQVLYEERKSGDLVPGAFVYLQIKRLIPAAGIIILEHVWRRKVLAP
jgi:hypothetical protein